MGEFSSWSINGERNSRKSLTLTLGINRFKTIKAMHPTCSPAPYPVAMWINYPAAPRDRCAFFRRRNAGFILNNDKFKNVLTYALGHAATWWGLHWNLWILRSFGTQICLTTLSLGRRFSVMHNRVLWKGRVTNTHRDVSSLSSPTPNFSHLFSHQRQMVLGLSWAQPDKWAQLYQSRDCLGLAGRLNLGRDVLSQTSTRLARYSHH